LSENAPTPKQGTNVHAYAAHGAFCYLAGVLFPIIYLTTEPYKSNRFIRFHAFQSIFFFAAWFVVFVACSVSLFPRRIGEVIYFAFFATWVVLMIKAYQGRMTKLPFVGILAERKAG